MLLDTRTPDPPDPTAAHPPLDELIDPTTGEVLNAQDADGLIDSYKRIDQHYRELADFRRRLAFALADLAPKDGDKRTVRVRGHEHAAKIELPDEGWSQSILKEAWHAYPSLREEFLRIDSIAVKKREWKKLENTGGPADLEQFKRMVAGAQLPPSGTPRITVEK